ncbi:MAG: hypothetical protein NC218_05230 [Acetobacter sp.]|nr:hypothetical protein [Acetobacter sp.]
MEKQFLISLLESGIKLNRALVVKLFELPDATEIVKAYLSRNYFTAFDNLQLLMFGRPDSPELILYYVEQGYGINPQIEEKLFELPNAEEVIKAYTAHHQLYSNLAQLKLFMFPDVVDILRTYIRNGHPLNAKAQVKLFDLPAPYAEEMVKLYKAKNFELCRNFRHLLRKNRWHKN